MAEDDDQNYSRRDWATLIRAVRTPLSFFTLALLVAQAILLGLAQRAVGRDFTILLSATLALTFVLVIAVAVNQFRSQAKREFTIVSDQKQKDFKYDVFLSVPMAAVGEPAYHEYRQMALALTECLEKECGKKGVYYAGANISTKSEFDPHDAAALDDLEAITQSKFFVLVFPKKVASSVIFEAGIALALGKKCLYFVKDRDHLPFLMQKAEQAFDEVKLYEYKKPSDIANILKNSKCFEFAAAG
jgi:hypothetical protein